METFFWSTPYRIFTQCAALLLSYTKYLRQIYSLSLSFSDLLILIYFLYFRYVFCSVSCKKKVYERLAEMAKSQLEQAANATVLALQAMAVSDEGERGGVVVVEMWWGWW